MTGGQNAKINTRKFHLINWNTVLSPKDNGGLDIKDLVLINLAPGAEVLWRLVAGKIEWWKQVLFKNYFQGSRKSCLDAGFSHSKGYPIWQLCRVVSPIIQSKLTWIPGNGKLIKIWDDGIMGQPLSIHNQELSRLHEWMIDQGIMILLDLSRWDAEDHWIGWGLLLLPS